MDRLEQEGVVVRRCAESGQAELYSLVLSARGIGSIIIEDSDTFNILTSPYDARQAREELLAYDRENPRRPPERRRFTPAPPNLEFLFLYWVVLVFFFFAARGDRFSVDWLEIGAAQTGLIRAGQWWRVVTALFLHVSGTHLLSNLVFGTVFLLLLCQVLGAGMTSLAVVVGGALGNAMNALVRPEDHTSIGASTAIFAAVGLLAALRQDWVKGRMSFSPRSWVPLAGGVMLLAFLGFGEGPTDIFAHVFGFAAGVGLGAYLARSDRAWPEDRKLQRQTALIAAGIVVLSWLLALATQW